MNPDTQNGGKEMKRAAAILGIVVAIFSLLGGAMGALLALETRVEQKIDRRVAPIAADVREIRQLLYQRLPHNGTP